MLDILIGIIAELLGQNKKQAQPRRKVRGDETTGRRDTGYGGEAPPAPRRKFESFEDFINQAVNEEEARPTPSEPPRPAAPPHRPKPSRPVPSVPPAPAAGKGRNPEPAQRTLAPVSVTEYAAASAAMTEASMRSSGDEAPPATSRETRSVVPEYISRLRNNPGAARQAFVYAEIFGPPLADRS